MSENIQKPFELHLPGLLKVLAEHLYSNKQVAVRELIQNAHDSCLRRQVAGAQADYQPRVEISIDAPNRTLIIRDNGSGLTEDEISNYLATIGRSYTRELRENLALLAPDEASKLIGQFGFGFLSAFLLASEVKLTTRSYRPDSQAFHWRSAGDEYYEVTPATRAEVGTTIELKIKPNASFVLRENILVETILQYADFLPIPIYLGDDPNPLNLMQPPWESPDVKAATLDYIQRVFKLSNPLCVVPLKDHTIDLGHDTMVIPLQGFLFVPPGSVASVREYGDLSIYIRRMAICQNEKDLLPPWARFVRGVIDCPYLQPTASREGIHQDETFASVQQALEEQLGAALRQIAYDDPAIWKQIVLGHTDVITGWAVNDNNFFEQVADIVAFHTSRGMLSLPEYLELTGGTLYYVTKELGSLQEQILAEGHGVPVIDASWFAVTPFLEKYASRHMEVRLARLDDNSEELLRPMPEAPFATLLEFYRGRGIQARVAAFKPMEMPTLMLYPKDAEFIQESRQALDAGEIPDALSSLIGDYIEGVSAERDDLNGTLYLNASCPLIRRLSEESSGIARDAALTLLYQLARLFAGRTLKANDATGAFGEAIKAIEVLLR